MRAGEWGGGGGTREGYGLGYTSIMVRPSRSAHTHLLELRQSDLARVEVYGRHHGALNDVVQDVAASTVGGQGGGYGFYY